MNRYRVTSGDVRRKSSELHTLLPHEGDGVGLRQREPDSRFGKNFRYEKVIFS